MTYKVLIDTNILVDAALTFRPESAEACRLLELVGLGRCLGYVSALNIALSIVVGVVFWFMAFHKLTVKHTARIAGYGEERQLFVKFFDRRSFAIMAVMMTGGIDLRASGLAPKRFIAVFYTGLGAALLLAGLEFGRNYGKIVFSARPSEKAVGKGG